jgi:hypothetical protein
MPVSVSLQPLLLWHSNLCAATYACCLSGKRGDFGSMAQHLTLCLVMLALLLVEPQCQQSASIDAGAREAEPAGKQVKRGSGATGLDTPARRVRPKSGACEGTRQGGKRARTGQQVPPSAAVGKSRCRPENALLPGCVCKERKACSSCLADQDGSGSLRGPSRDGSRSPRPACSVEGTTAPRGAPSRTGTREAHAATAGRLPTGARANRRAEPGDGAGTACKVPRPAKGQTVRCLVDCAARWCGTA